MAQPKYGKKKAQYRKILISLTVMPVIAILTFLGVVTLDQLIGWLALAVFVVALIVYFVKFNDSQSGMQEEGGNK